LRINIKDIEIDEDIYPRKHKNEKTISSYVEALKANAMFPPIEVQKISVDGGKKTILLDGLHRLEAHKCINKDKEVKDELKAKEIDAFFFNDDTLEKKDNLKILRIEAISQNLKHGDRLDNKDKQECCRRMAEDDREITIKEKDFAEIFCVSRQTVNNWIKDIRAKQRGSRNNIIYKLSLLGWAQEEIGDVVGLDQSVIAKIMQNANFGNLHKEYNEGKPIEQIAKYYGLDLQTTYAICLQELSDEEKAEKLGIDIRKFTVWNFSDANPLMGNPNFNGRIPGEIPFNALYWFTEPNDLVIDPMCGSGTTLDACLLLGRKAYGYDIKPTRNYITKNDIFNGIPIKKKADFIFVNPPYWSVVEYPSKEGNNLALTTLDHFYEGIEALAKSSYDILKPNKMVAVLMGNQSAQYRLNEREETKDISRLDHVLKTINIFLEEHFSLEWRIYCPMPTQGANRWATKEWENKRLAEIGRELLVLKRE
jgi:hypothetical protein